MEQELLIEQVEAGASIREISNETNKSPTTIRYWLKKYGLKTKNLSFKDGYHNDRGLKRQTDTHKYCPACDVWKEHIEFYLRKNRNNQLLGWCKSCCHQSAKMRQQETKRKAVEYMGGCCKGCGYNGYVGALEFHHLDPSQKDPSWGTKKTSPFESIKAELDKCIMLCANCHREIHAGILSI